MTAWDRIRCVLGDITAQDLDCVVNAANESLRGGGGVDGAIHRAAGPELLRECIERYPDGCPTGEARLTKGYRLQARFVIHTVGPIYQGGDHGERELLESCHHSSLSVAAENGIETLAFPAISTGAYGYPLEEAARVSLSALSDGLGAHADIRGVRMVLFSEELLEVFETELGRQRG